MPSTGPRVSATLELHAPRQIPAMMEVAWRHLLSQSHCQHDRSSRPVPPMGYHEKGRHQACLASAHHHGEGARSRFRKNMPKFATSATVPLKASSLHAAHPRHACRVIRRVLEWQAMGVVLDCSPDVGAPSVRFRKRLFRQSWGVHGVGSHGRLHIAHPPVAGERGVLCLDLRAPTTLRAIVSISIQRSFSGCGEVLVLLLLGYVQPCG